ncbi:DUF294 nucleotidyltransferase-like domain-containing protein [Alicyclobacillus fastidiosus]|uniref:DUF294 nucleotidyltransferase-like domain-containing protein n=1 Tax=Alicyclobacillus fastidiosus TaxID=392011 RepID=A0ABY6ZGT9_9BACL|nr:putative nucleotidyltransferase substrate binding domain-containing protein [Alicyclobacillus fastidiosus]WAH42113.1 DUF294 nucleotidyltransferase-like domain-containing protein [Alicyclobacillus fastidiosus]GMA63891.1 hypothetical protein GCM10025859_43310 [Alicyclobacillus fastidiosus]
MVAFPPFDRTWLAVPEGQRRRREWLEAVAEVSLAWFLEGKSIEAWLDAFQPIREQALKLGWSYYLPEEIRTHLHYIRFGSGGRGEDLIYSDLDYAIVTTGSVDAATVMDYLHDFIRGMNDFGFPPCQGFVMGTNPRWIGSTEDFARRIHQYLAYPDWENTRYLFMVVDGRPLFSFDGWSEISDLARNGICNSPFIRWEMAHLGIHKTVSLSLLGHVQTERVDDVEVLPIKEGLISPIIHSIRLLALTYRIGQLGTGERLKELERGGWLAPSLVSRVQRALAFGWKLRVMAQIRDALGKGSHKEHVLWSALSEDERVLAAQHLHTARELERLVHRTFRKPR